MKIKRFLSRFRDLFSYAIFGFMASVINVFVYWGAHHVLGWGYLLANTLAWLLSNLFGFFTNKSLVFGSKYTNFTDLVIEIVQFFVFRGMTFFLDTGLMFVGISLLKWSSMWTKIADQLIVGIVNYVTSRWTFRKENKEMIARGRQLARKLHESHRHHD
ncbi:gtcA1 protein [Lactobacillus selangorensis]|uniref:GtcA1 protein n=1 Tax=Lactobacillus selangorensis TaxID=81857 RepID=A0A0R2FIA5_9LACO|nr:GtrA family protein [Lactobacillus selangorensis]KRN28339.1 gtcA1 protein [Lactobacillus selangorensis]KRN31841.1 gtcA1 protein [Lactobacillus selangorensis]